MGSTSEALPRAECEARLFELAMGKHDALLRIVLAKRREIFEKLAKIVHARLFDVRPEDQATYRENYLGTPPELDPVLNFHVELGKIEDIVGSVRQTFSPYEDFWKNIPESSLASEPDVDTRNPELAAVSDTYNPQILENDRVWLHVIMKSIDDGEKRIELSRWEEERLFTRLSGEKGRVASFSLEQLLYRDLLMPTKESLTTGRRAYHVDRCRELRESHVALRRSHYVIDGLRMYDVWLPKFGDNDEKDQCFHIAIPDDLQALWLTLFDKRTQKLIGAKEPQNPHDHPLMRTREGSMYVPILWKGMSPIPVMHEDASVLVPVAGLPDPAWYRSHMLSQNELESMKR